MLKYELVKSTIQSINPGLVFKMSLGDVENANAVRNVNYAVVADSSHSDDELFDDYLITVFGRRRHGELSGCMILTEILPWRFFLRDELSESGVPVAGFLSKLMINSDFKPEILFIHLDSKNEDYKIKVMLSDLTDDWASYTQSELERDLKEIIKIANLELDKKGKIMGIKETFESVKEKVADVIDEVKEKVADEKPVDIKNTAELKAKVSDVEVFGNPDTWMLLSKASSKAQGWMKSTKVMNVPGGVVLQASTQVKDNVAEALTFIPNVKAVKNPETQEVTIQHM